MQPVQLVPFNRKRGDGWKQHVSKCGVQVPQDLLIPKPGPLMGLRVIHILLPEFGECYPGRFDVLATLNVGYAQSQKLFRLAPVRRTCAYLYSLFAVVKIRVPDPAALVECHVFDLSTSCQPSL